VKAADQFHAGIVTDAFDATVTELTDLYGYEWCIDIAMPMPVVLPTGDAVVDLHLVYSRTTPRIEIVQSIPGTVWRPAAGSDIHHLGYWCDDVVGDCRVLQERGYLLEATGKGADGAPSWAYLHRDGRPRVELVARGLQAGLETMWAAP
jgi:hypothetical protein